MELTYRFMVDIQTKSLCALDPRTLNAMHGVATALGGQRRYEEARLAYKHIIELKRSTSGDEHPHILNSMHNLAGILTHQGNTKKLGICMIKSFKLKEGHLGQNIHRHWRIRLGLSRC